MIYTIQFFWAELQRKQVDKVCTSYETYGRKSTINRLPYSITRGLTLSKVHHHYLIVHPTILGLTLPNYSLITPYHFLLTASLLQLEFHCIFNASGSNPLCCSCFSLLQIEFHCIFHSRGSNALCACSSTSAIIRQV